MYQDSKKCPRRTLRPRPRLEDNITDFKRVHVLLQHLLCNIAEAVCCRLDDIDDQLEDICHSTKFLEDQVHELLSAQGTCYKDKYQSAKAPRWNPLGLLNNYFHLYYLIIFPILYSMLWSLWCFAVVHINQSGMWYKCGSFLRHVWWTIISLCLHSEYWNDLLIARILYKTNCVSSVCTALAEDYRQHFITCKCNNSFYYYKQYCNLISDMWLCQ